MRSRSRNLLVLAASLLSLLSVVLLTASAPARAAAPAGAINVSPGQLNFLLSQGATEQTQTLTITNNYDTELHLAGEFKGIDETAGRLVPTNNLETNLGRSLYLSQTDIRIAPHQSQALQVAITNPDSLSPGGHYATLVLTQQNDKSQVSAYRAAVSISLYVVKVDGEKEHLTVKHFDTDGWLFKMPSTATLTFVNQGNIHIVPRAAISIMRHDNLSVIAKGTANQSSLPLLPGKELTVTAPIQSFGSLWLPKRLDIVAAYRADGDSVPQYIRRSMFFIPPVYPLLLVAIIAIVALLRRRKRQSRRPTAKAATGHRPKQPITTPKHHTATPNTPAPAAKRRTITVHDDPES